MSVRQDEIQALLDEYAYLPPAWRNTTRETRVLPDGSTRVVVVPAKRAPPQREKKTSASTATPAREPARSKRNVRRIVLPGGCVLYVTTVDMWRQHGFQHGGNAA